MGDKLKLNQYATIKVIGVGGGGNCRETCVRSGKGGGRW